MSIHNSFDGIRTPSHLPSSSQTIAEKDLSSVDEKTTRVLNTSLERAKQEIVDSQVLPNKKFKVVENQNEEIFQIDSSAREKDIAIEVEKQKRRIAILKTKKSAPVASEPTVPQDAGVIKKVSFSKKTSLADISKISKMSDLEEVEFNENEDFYIFNSVLTLLAKLKTIHLNKCSQQFKSSFLKHLRLFTNLSSLTFKYIDIFDNDCEEIGKLKNLEFLHISNQSYLTDNGMIKLSKNRSLKVLELPDSYKLTDSSLGCMKTKWTLETLIVPKRSKFSGSGLRNLEESSGTTIKSVMTRECDNQLTRSYLADYLFS